MALSNVRWEGMKAVEVMTKTLPKKLGGQKLRSAYRYALKPVLNDMRNNIPRHKTGRLLHATAINIGGNQDLESMFAVVGPRRKRGSWNQQGWHAHLVEGGTKPHTITAGEGKLMPVFNKSGFTGEFAKVIEHKGSRAYRPFSRGIDSNWGNVANTVSDKMAEIIRQELKNIYTQYGSIATT